MWDLARRWVGAPALRLMHPQTPDSPDQKEPPILRTFPRTPRSAPLRPSAQMRPRMPDFPDRREPPGRPPTQPRRSPRRPAAKAQTIVSSHRSPAQVVAAKDRLGQLHVRVERADHKGRVATLLRAQRHLLDVGLTAL